MVLLLPGGGDRPPGPLAQPGGRRRAGPDRLPRLGGELDDLDDLDLLRLFVAGLFRHDAAGRITGTNEPEPDRAPRLFLGRSSGGNVWRLRDDLPIPLVDRLEATLRREPVAGDLAESPAVLDELLAALGAHAPIEEISSGPAWSVADRSIAARAATIVGPADAHLLRPNFPYLARHVAGYSPCAAVAVDGVAVSVCSSARVSAGACEAGVDTVAEHRGRGFAADAVVAWADAVRRSGRRPLYSTSWDNHASRRVAEKLGMRRYGVGLSIF